MHLKRPSRCYHTLPLVRGICLLLCWLRLSSDDTQLLRSGPLRTSMPWSGRHPSRRPFFAVGTALGQDAAAKAQRVSDVARLPQVTVVKLHLSVSGLLMGLLRWQTT